MRIYYENIYISKIYIYIHNASCFHFLYRAFRLCIGKIIDPFAMPPRTPTLLQLHPAVAAVLPWRPHHQTALPKLLFFCSR